MQVELTTVPSVSHKIQFGFYEELEEIREAVGK